MTDKMESNTKYMSKAHISVLVIILVLLLAICATAGVTLAKYVNSVTVESQVTTIAKWGYTLTADTSKMFGGSYGEVDGTTKLAKVSSTGTVVCKGSSNGGAIVAPGTTGYMLIKLQGTAEVNALLTIDVTDFETIMLANSDGNGNAYRPLAWTVNDKELTGDIAKTDVATAIADVINAEVQAGSITVPVDKEITVSVSDSKITVTLPANTDFGTNGIELKISWAWAYSNGEESAKLDTILGLIAENKGTDGELDQYNGTVFQVSIGLEALLVQTQGE